MFLTYLEKHMKVNSDSTKALITIIGKGYLKSKNLLILLKIVQFKIETVSTDKKENHDSLASWATITHTKTRL